MIVKNESAVIERCLDSVRTLVDYILIEDTGSTDGTQNFIRAWMERNGIPGEVIDEPWQDFAFNRSHVMAQLRQRGQVDYAFIIDADDELEIDDGFDITGFKTQMNADLYDLEIRHGGSRHWRPQICSNGKPFNYRGVLHEFIELPPGAIRRETPSGLAIRIALQGARSQDPQKYQKDAALLESTLHIETDPFLRSRYTFYLAQSYRDFGAREKALEAYLARAEMGFWDQERYVALYMAANLKADLDYPPDEVIVAYERATALCPDRAEALHAASRFCRLKGRNEEGFRFAERGLALPSPTGALFAEPYVYEYGLLDELSVNGYWSGHYRASLDACLKLLANDRSPADQRSRHLANAQAALAKLPRDPNLGSAAIPDLVAQHPLTTARELRSNLPDPAPRVLIAILAKQKESFLPLYLECIEGLDYPKSSIVLYVRTNNNTDATETILRDWLARVRHSYAAIEFDPADVDVKVELFGAHEWNASRFQVLGNIRNVSLQRTKAHACEFYFVADVDNFVRPCTLRELVALDLPIVSPLLRAMPPGAFYSNYHAEIDSNGYYRDCDQYQWILNRWVRGVIEVPVVHCTYLIRRDALDVLTYVDESNRFEYVIFSDSARRAAVPQYIDNRQIYGYITFGEGHELHVHDGLNRAKTFLFPASDVSCIIAEQIKSHSTNNQPFLLVHNTSAGADSSFKSSDPVSGKKLANREIVEQLNEIHLINLDRDSERLALFESRNAHLGRVTRVSGVDGGSLNRSELVKSGDITADLEYKDGSLGCSLSHISLWKKAVAENRIITIFEDDTLSAEDFKESTVKLTEDLDEDWDIILWGFIFRPSFMWLDFAFTKAKLEFYDQKDHTHPTEYSRVTRRRQLLKLQHADGAPAYSVSPLGARKLLEACLPLRNQHIPYPGTGVVIANRCMDNVMSGEYPRLQAYACFPPLVIQDASIRSSRLSLDAREGESSLLAHNVSAPSPEGETNTLTEPPFPDILIINLDRRKDRWETIEKLCIESGLRPTRVQAVEEPPAWKACTLSHLNCIRIAKENGWPWVLVMEDDASFSKESLDRFRSLLPVLWKNRDKWERFNGGPTLSAEHQISILDEKAKLLYVNGLAAHFNLVNESGYDVILAWNEESDKIIDAYYSELGSKSGGSFRNVATVPHVSTQTVSVSDLTPTHDGSSQDYSDYFKASEWFLSRSLQKSDTDILETRIIDDLRAKIWDGYDPLLSFPYALYSEDSAGWQSQHPFLREAVEELRPHVVVEIGVWKGGSTLTMAHKIQELGLNGAVVAIDTWLGSTEHWLNPEWRQDLFLVNGYPRLFEKFAANVLHHGLGDVIVPLPLDSINARNVLTQRNIVADLIHIDAGHDFTSVMTDLDEWWTVLRTGGVLIADDYFAGGASWPDVFRAMNSFLEKTPHRDFQFHSGKCRVTKI